MATKKESATIHLWLRKRAAFAAVLGVHSAIQNFWDGYENMNRRYMVERGILAILKGWPRKIPAERLRHHCVMANPSRGWLRKRHPVGPRQYRVHGWLRKRVALLPKGCVSLGYPPLDGYENDGEGKSYEWIATKTP
jgi:hypothetical protein